MKRRVFLALAMTIAIPLAWRSRGRIVGSYVHIDGWLLKASDR